jgi:hypothetical protein
MRALGWEFSSELPKTAVSPHFVPFGMLGKPYILAYENTSLSTRISREIGMKMEVAHFHEIKNRLCL